MHAVKGTYQALVTLGGWFQPVLMLLLRVFLGFAFYQAGIGKFGHIDNFANFLGSAGLPLPTFQAYLVAVVEAVGGILLLVGFASRFAGFVLMFNMIVAYLIAHFDVVVNLLTNPSMFVEQQAFLYLLTAALVFAYGPGLFSLDRLLGAERKEN